MSLIDQQFLLTPWISIINIGVPKTGKTRSVASIHDYMLAKKQKYTSIYMYDFDGNGSIPLIRLADAGHWLSDLKVFRYNTRRGGKKIAGSVAPARSVEDFETFKDEFNQLFDMIDPRTSTWRENLPTQPPGCIVFDSGTALEDIIYDFVLCKRGREFGEGEIITSGKNAGNTTKDVTGSDWISMKDKEIEIIESAKALPAHFIYNCHELLTQEIISAPQNRTGDPISPIATGVQLQVPALTGDLKSNMPKYFDVVVFSECNEGRYEWRTKPGGRIKMAGTRLRDDLPPRVKQDYREILL